MALNYNSELKISLLEAGNTRATLALDANGDVQLVSGRDKLNTHLVRLIINDNVNFVNESTYSDRDIKNMLTAVLKNYKASQIDEINKVDDSLLGYHVYRKQSSSTDNYIKITTMPAMWTFVDNNVENGIDYEYRVNKVYSGNFVSDFFEKFTVTPSAFTIRQRYQIGSKAVVFNGNASVTFYFESLKYFKKSELLNNVESITAAPNIAEPRKMDVNIVIIDANDNFASIATGSVKLNNG